MKTSTIIVVALVVAIIAIAGLLFFIRSSIHIIAPPPAVHLGAIQLGARLVASGYLTYSNAQSLVEYSFINYSFRNATNATLSLTVFDQRPVMKVYLVNASSECVNCFAEAPLEANITSYLSRYGLIPNASSFTIVDLSQLQSLPGSSIVILPTGLLPTDITPDSGTFNITTMLAKGDVIVYAGLPFNQSVGPGGTVFVNSPQTISELDDAGLGTVSPRSVRNTTKAQIPLSFKQSSQTFVFINGALYGPITYARSGPGVLIAFSNYPTTGWGNTQAMAGDIAASLDSRFWMGTIGRGSMQLNLTRQNATGNINVFTTNAPINATINQTTLGNYYSLVEIKAYNATSFATKDLVFQQSFAPNGTLGIQKIVPQTQSVAIQISPAKTTGVVQSPHIDLYTANLTYVGTVPLGFFNSSLSVIKYYPFFLPGGYYVAILRDFNNRYYSSALFDVANTTITPVSLNFSNETFKFDLTSAGVQLTNASYDLSLNGEYPAKGTITDGRVTYVLPKGSTITYGNQAFTFGLFGANYTYNVSYNQAPFHIPAIYIEFAIAAVIIVLLNIILQPPNRDDYFIDVPTFPPVKKTAVKTSADSVVGLFDKVNMTRGWHYMPLTAEEVKLGVSNSLRVNNLQVAITLQNTINVLSTLMVRGYVVNVLDYYAPKKWLEESKHDMEYLVAFRKLRDYCVPHAIRFSELDADPNCDVLLTTPGGQSMLFIYSGSKGLKQIKITPDSRVFVLFVSEDSRLSFMDRLYSSYGEQAETLKTGIAYNYVKLVDAEHLDQLIL